MTKNHTLINHRACLWALTFALGVAPTLACSPGYADDNPFDLDSSHWMSFDHYKDADKRGTLDKIAPPSLPAVSAETPETPPEGAGAAKLAVAAPTRPIDLPVMPGLNKGFNVQVNSTEDQQSSLTIPVIDATKPADLHLSDKNWQTPASAQIATKDDDGEGDKPLNVRMTFLPDKKIVPIPSPEHASGIEAGRAALLKNLKNGRTPLASQSAKTPAEVAACAAIDAYKKQQLDAIQSDRQTLTALQDAIHSLGLEKQLDFIAGSNGALNASGQQSSANTTPPTTVR